MDPTPTSTPAPPLSPAPAAAAAAAPPGFVVEPMTPTQILFSFKGRVPRHIWWLYGVLALIGAGLLAVTLLSIAGIDPLSAESLVNVLLLWPALAVSIKRWHDRNKSGWWVLVGLLPLVGWIWVLIENGMLRGTMGPNRFGEDLTDRF
jgi:uncharacterized membrane protein YhaH (DUF805 family)